MRPGLIALCLLFSTATALASPPPPPPDYVMDAATVLTANPTPQTFAAYARCFADDLRVYAEDRVIASDKASWLDAEKARLGKVDRQVLGYAEGGDHVMVVDEYDDRSALPDLPGMVYDARFVTRSARYQFGQDHLVHEIRFVQGDGFWIPLGPRGQSATASVGPRDRVTPPAPP